MSEIEQEMLKYLKRMNDTVEEMNNTVEKINFKMDKNHY